MIEVKKQTTKCPWTNKIRLVKNRKSWNEIHEFDFYCFVEGLKFRMNMKEFLILFVMHEKAK